MTFLSIVLVGCGGAVGAVLRFYFSTKWNKESLPLGTLAVNLVGSMVLGVLIGVAVPDRWLLFAGTGLMGALTTFSTFQLEGWNMLTDRKRKRYFLYQGLSYAGGIALAFAGFLIGNILS
ncbi:fluoride efflux transporter FluC [Salimicrobium flavidum]|uniref:Fluoride-specific ion channel FluC n=1 Tax=Salimicrobium flavidum TaxID=570947 RepID=A0A1N7J686_9BACI|nr:CrcB family protein [Salimicrobium flavidum]SIS44878.1 camphor resistance protein CrcB [Salimicrobium flavidum]